MQRPCLYLYIYTKIQEQGALVHTQNPCLPSIQMLDMYMETYKYMYSIYIYTYVYILHLVICTSIVGRVAAVLQW